MWLRRRIQCEAGIGTVWNVRADEKLRWCFQNRLQSGRGNRHNSDNATASTDEGRFYGMMSGANDRST